MATPRLYCPELAVGDNLLSAEESHHALAVVRIKVGDAIVLFDGRGGEAAGSVDRIEQRRLCVAAARVERHIAFDLSRRVALAVAMPKAHRQGYMIEKCVELGVAAIWPIVTQRGVAKPGAAAVQKWSRRAIEAAKQSRRRWIPVIEPPMDFAESMARSGEFDLRGLADIDCSGKQLCSVLSALPPNASVLIWIGPEGGWTDEERECALAAGAVPVRLGPTVLRTETAAVAVCAAAALCDSGSTAVE